jgi:hypothetical protein
MTARARPARDVAPLSRERSRQEDVVRSAGLAASSHASFGSISAGWQWLQVEKSQEVELMDTKSRGSRQRVAPVLAILALRAGSAGDQRKVLL